MKKINIISAALSSPIGWLIYGEGPESKIEQAIKEGKLTGLVGHQELKSDTQSEGQLMAAFFEGGEDLSEEEMAALWQDAKDYIQWKLSQRRKAKDDQ